MNYLQKKKLAFMSIVNQIKGFIRTISGAFPLTLTDCVDNKSITNYSIHGNSMQDGVPTPGAPIEVESVGEKIVNLFEGYDEIIDGYYTATGDFTAEIGIRTAQYIAVKPNTVYTVKGRCTKTTQCAYIRIAEFNSDKIFVNRNLTLYEYEPVITFKTTNDTMFLAICYDSDETGAIATVTDIQIDEGTVSNDYTLYGKYKIPITVISKNIDNFSIVSDQYNVKTEKIAPNIFKVTKSNNDAVAYGQIETYLEIGKTYTLFRMSESEKPIGNIPAWKEYNAGGVYNYATPTYFTFTATQERFILGLYPNQSADLKGLETTFTFMLVEGSYTSTTFPDYEPYHESISTNIYLDEPLRKVGDYADHIDFENGKVIRQVGKAQYGENGNYDAYYLNDTRYGFYTFQSDMKKGARADGFCNYLYNRKGEWMSDTWFGVDTRVIYLFLKDIYNSADTDVERVQALKDWLAKLETPFLVYYILDTPTETPLTLPIIPTFKGTSIISVDTTIQPSNAEIEYYSNAKER